MLTVSDMHAFKEALTAAAEGPFFQDWEFHTLFGLERSELRCLASQFSVTSSVSSSVSFAISAACNNLLGYPHGQERAWPQWISVPPEELSAAYARLRASVKSG
jgi:hypothetical protein